MSFFVGAAENLNRFASRAETVAFTRSHPTPGSAFIILCEECTMSLEFEVSMPLERLPEQPIGSDTPSDPSHTLKSHTSIEDTGHRMFNAIAAKRCSIQNAVWKHVQTRLQESPMLRLRALLRKP